MDRRIRGCAGRRFQLRSAAHNAEKTSLGMLKLQPQKSGEAQRFFAGVVQTKRKVAFQINDTGRP